MKKILCSILLICLLLPGASIAETQAAYSIPSHVTDAFSTNTGKTVIQFDADVTAYEFEHLPLYSVRVNSFSQEDIRTIADSFGFSRNTKPKLKKYDDTGSSFKGFSMDVYTFVDGKRTLYIFNEYMNGKPIRASFDFEISDEKAEFSTNNKLLPMEESERSSQAVMEARSLAETLNSSITPALSLNAYGWIHGAPVFTGNAPEPETNKTTDVGYASMFLFSRTLNQVPVTITGTRMGAANEYSPGVPEEVLSVVIKAGKVIAAHFQSPYQLEEAGTFDRQSLVPFDTVMETAKRILPLMRLSRESAWATADAPERLEITRITFGYVRINVPNQPNVYQLVPAWDFFGSLTRQARLYENKTYVFREIQEDYAIECYLTINALTGEVIDREHGY